MRPKSYIQGFTLIEVLVALLVLAIIATMGVVGLQAIITTDSRQEVITDEFSELQFAYLLIQRDITQVIQRPIRDSLNEERPAFLGLSGQIKNLPFDVQVQGNIILEFTRDGVPNPQQLPNRSTLQRVSYTYDETGNLKRYAWLALDRVTDSVFLERVVLKEIKNLRLTYFDIGGQRTEQWATSVLNSPEWLKNFQQRDSLPAAMEWRFEHPRYGEVMWMFLMPGANNVQPITIQ